MPDVNTGTVANDGTGDPLRDAFIKLNETDRQHNLSFTVTGFPRLTVGGTPDAIVATVPAGVENLNIGATGTHVMIRPTATNTSDNPTLQIGTGFIRTIQPDGGGTLGANRLVPGVWHVIHLSSNGAARIQGIFVRPSDIPALRALVDANTATATVLSTDVTELKARPYLLFAEQVANTLPARPNSRVVHWYCWSDPTALMRGTDLWFQLPDPTVPDMPATDSWRWANGRTGSSGVLQILSLPEASPPITSVQYRLDGGSWTTAPAQVGDVSIAGLSSGQSYALEFRYVNFLGGGVPSEPRGIVVSGSGFIDDFNRADQVLSNSPNWIDILTGANGRRLSISANALRGPATNETYVAQVPQYFAADQYVEAAVLSAGTNTSAGRGAAIYARMPDGAHSGYRLRLAGTTWALARIIDGVSSTLASGSRTATFPVQARMVVTTEAGVVNVRAVIGGSEVANVNDTSADRLLGGTIGVMINAAGADGIDAVRMDNVQAGNV